MKTLRRYLIISYGLFLLFLIAFNIPWTRTLYSFSRQDPVNPDTLVDQPYNPYDRLAYYNNEAFNIPFSVARLGQISQVLGDTTSNKRIEVDLTNQRLYAFENDQKIYDFLVSTGKWGRTPTGTFRIWTKLRYTKMSGGSQALGTYYYLPNVPYTMFFYNESVPKSRGYGLHGTYWHSNFGHPMSHGCVNMKTEEAGMVFSWADIESTPIVIYGTAPNG